MKGTGNNRLSLGRNWTGNFFGTGHGVNWRKRSSWHQGALSKPAYHELSWVIYYDETSYNTNITVRACLAGGKSVRMERSKGIGGRILGPWLFRRKEKKCQRIEWRISNPSKKPFLISPNIEGLDEGTEHNKWKVLSFISIFLTQVLYLSFLSPLPNIA